MLKIFVPRPTFGSRPAIREPLLYIIEWFRSLQLFWRTFIRTPKLEYPVWSMNMLIRVRPNNQFHQTLSSIQYHHFHIDCLFLFINLRRVYNKSYALLYSIEYNLKSDKSQTVLVLCVTACFVTSEELLLFFWGYSEGVILFVFCLQNKTFFISNTNIKFNP
jgi:hypothetical protein